MPGLVTDLTCWTACAVCDPTLERNFESTNPKYQVYRQCLLSSRTKCFQETQCCRQRVPTASEVFGPETFPPELDY